MDWLSFLPDISLPENIDIDIINIGPEVDKGVNLSVKDAVEQW